MQSWSSKAPNGRIQQHKHTKHGAKNDQSRIWAHSRIVQLHCMFSASEYPQICSDYWLFYQLYSPSSLFLKNFANQSRPACAAGTQCASFSTSKITKNYPQNPESLSFHRNCLQIHQKKNTHPKKKNKSKKSVIPKKNPPPPVTTAFGSEAAAIGPPDLHGAGVAGGVQGDQVFPVLLGAPVAKNWETWRKWGKRWGDEEEST